MALTVEDGSGVADADSYVSLAEYEAYAGDMAQDLSGTAASREANLRRAAFAIDTGYLWRADSLTTTQGLHFPEEGETSIPRNVRNAQCELALLIQNGSDPLSVNEGGAIKRTRVKVDAIEEETEYSSPTTGAQFSVIDRLLSGFYSGKSASAPGAPSTSVSVVGRS